MADNLPENLVAGDGVDIAQGKKTFETRCADCHGLLGRGDGPASLDLDPRPTDLSSPTLAEKTDAALFQQITEGKRPMPSYKNKLSEEKRWQLVKYVRTLGANGKSKVALNSQNRKERALDNQE